MKDLLPETLAPCIPHITPYLLCSFGSFGRVDYGSGHELCFSIFLLCLLLLRFFQPAADEERLLVLGVFERYMRIVWRLQDVYKLEPAGSHGVWGLDDYHFLPYLWGSAQLRSEYRAAHLDIYSYWSRNRREKFAAYIGSCPTSFTSDEPLLPLHQQDTCP